MPVAPATTRMIVSRRWVKRRPVTVDSVADARARFVHHVAICSLAYMYVRANGNNIVRPDPLHCIDGRRWKGYVRACVRAYL